MCSARGGKVHGLSITLAWWQLLALCWMINNWLPVQLLLTGYFKNCHRDPPWTHQKNILKTRKPTPPPYTNSDLDGKAQRWMQVQESFQRGIAKSHFWWGRRPAIPMHLDIDQGAVPLAPRLWHHWWQFEVPAPSAFSGLVFILVASFPNKDKLNLQEVQSVTEES